MKLLIYYVHIMDVCIVLRRTGLSKNVIEMR